MKSNESDGLTVLTKKERAELLEEARKAVDAAALSFDAMARYAAVLEKKKETFHAEKRYDAGHFQSSEYLKASKLPPIVCTSCGVTVTNTRMLRECAKECGWHFYERIESSLSGICPACVSRSRGEKLEN